MGKEILSLMKKAAQRNSEREEDGGTRSAQHETIKRRNPEY
jgi:hypothetical protein